MGVVQVNETPMLSHDGPLLYQLNYSGIPDAVFDTVISYDLCMKPLSKASHYRVLIMLDSRYMDLVKIQTFQYFQEHLCVAIH